MKKILIIRLGAIGDVLSSLYLLPYLNNYEVKYLVDEPSAEFIQKFTNNVKL